MKGVLLAAGRGTRLAPLTDGVPKILAPLFGRTLLEHQLEYLARNGVTELAINVHHHADQVLSMLERIEVPFSVVVSCEEQLLGTAGALAPLRDFLTEPFVVLYADVVTTADLGQLLEAHRASDAFATLAYYRSEATAGKGILVLDDTGRISGFVEKPASHPGSVCINAGLYALGPRILEVIRPAKLDFGFDIWPAALASGEVLRGFELEGFVYDIGSPEALSAVERALAEGALRW